MFRRQAVIDREHGNLADIGDGNRLDQRAVPQNERAAMQVDQNLVAIFLGN